MIPRAAAVIPVYNHGRTLRPVVEGVLRRLPLVVVVDDGSSDGGAATLKGLPVRRVRLPHNQGKGAALLAGAAVAAAAGATHMVTLDADGQHLPEDIPLFLEALNRTPNAFIVGCRDLAAARAPAASRFGRAFSAFWMRVQTGVPVRDMQSGYRVYPLRLLRCLRFTERGYAFEVEVLVRAAWAGFAIREIPVQVYYPPPGERISHFHALRDNLRMTLLNTRLTVRALLPLPFHQHQVDAAGRVSLRHPLDLLRGLLARQATPKELGRAAAVSVAVSTLPLPGLQSILLLWCISRWRLNRLCALVMVPLTWPPLVPGLGVLLGYRLRNGRWLSEFSLQTLGYEAPQRLLDWLAGAFCLAPILGLLTGMTIWTLAAFMARCYRQEERP